MSGLVSKTPYVHLHVSIGLVPGVTVTSNEWLRFLPRGNRFEILPSWQTSLGVTRWPQLHCFALQSSLSFVCLCFAGVLGRWVCYLDAARFSVFFVLFYVFGNQNNVVVFAVFSCSSLLACCFVVFALCSVSFLFPAWSDC